MKAAREEEIYNDKRNTNLIIFYIDKSKKENPNAKYKDAKVKCSKIFEEVKEYNIEQLIRLGKNKEDGKERPLLVRM